MSIPASPRDPTHPHRPGQSEPPGVDEDTHEPNPFGPDGPNIRDDDHPGGPPIPLAPSPTRASEPLDEDQIAPDET
jgi:hypothetical protein